MKTICIAAFLALTSLTFSQNDDPKNSPLVAPSKFFSVYAGRSELILGSEDRRQGGGAALGWGRPEKRFTWGDIPGQLVYEFYYDHTESGRDRDQVDAFGALAYARWRWPMRNGYGFYATVGWGLQYANETSIDLNTQINSTPMVGMGFVFDTRHGEVSVGVRLLHISNAGLVPPNQGQNQLFLVYSMRF